MNGPALSRSFISWIIAFLGITGALCSCVSLMGNCCSDSFRAHDAKTGHWWAALYTKVRSLHGIYQAADEGSLLVVMPVVETCFKTMRAVSYTVYRIQYSAAQDRWNHTEEIGLCMDEAGLRDRNGSLRYRLYLPDNHRGATDLQDIHHGQCFMRQHTSVQYYKCVLVPEEFVAQAKEVCYMKQIVPGFGAQSSLAPSAVSGVYCYDTADDDTIEACHRTPHYPDDMIVILPCKNKSEFSFLHIWDKGEDCDDDGIPTPYGFRYTGASAARMDHLIIRDGCLRTAQGRPVCSFQVSGGKVIGLWRTNGSSGGSYYTKQDISFFPPHGKTPGADSGSGGKTLSQAS